MMPDTTTQPHGLPAPRMLPGQEHAHDAADDQGDAQEQGEHGRRINGLLEGDDAGGDIERAQQPPEDGLAPVLDAEGGDDLGDARP